MSSLESRHDRSLGAGESSKIAPRELLECITVHYDLNTCFPVNYIFREREKGFGVAIAGFKSIFNLENYSEVLDAENEFRVKILFDSMKATCKHSTWEKHAEVKVKDGKSVRECINQVLKDLTKTKEFRNFMKEKEKRRKKVASSLVASK